jgi:hypothetical protein
LPAVIFAAAPTAYQNNFFFAILFLALSVTTGICSFSLF